MAVRRDGIPCKRLQAPTPSQRHTGQLRPVTACNSLEKSRLSSFQAAIRSPVPSPPLRLKRCHHFGQRLLRGVGCPVTNDGVRDRRRRVLSESRKTLPVMPPRRTLLASSAAAHHICTFNRPTGIRKLARHLQVATESDAQTVNTQAPCGWTRNCRPHSRLRPTAIPRSLKADATSRRASNKGLCQPHSVAVQDAGIPDNPVDPCHVAQTHHECFGLISAVWANANAPIHAHRPISKHFGLPSFALRSRRFRSVPI